MARRTLPALLRLLIVATLTLLIAPVLGPPAQAQRSATTVNLELVLDSSGSMSGELEGGQTRIDAAKQVLREVIGELPEREGVNVGFRVYGHKGSNTEAGKDESCRSTELQVPIEGVDKDALLGQVDTYAPVGWTPLALSINEAAKDFAPAAENVVNAVLVVTDGLETCGGNPCTASRAAKRGDAAITTHVVSFALTEEETANLQCIVDESGGLLLGAGNASELSAALFQILEEIEVVVQNGFVEIESIGGVFPKATIEGQGEATDADPDGGEPFSVTLADSTKVEVPAGTYAVFWTNPSGFETRITVTVAAGETTLVRGSIIRFPHGAGETYTLTDQAGVLIWRDQIETGDAVWVLPGVYRLELDELTGNPILLSLEVQTSPGSVVELDVLTAP